MAINYTNYLASNITGNTTVYNPTATGIQATVIGLTVANNTANTAIANVAMWSGSTRANIVSTVSIFPGTTLNVVDASRIIVAANNLIAISSSQSVDVIVSVIEVT
jgi:hypothetical protein